MDSTISVTGLLEVPHDVPVSNPTPPNYSIPKEVIRVSTSHEAYPQTGEHIGNDFVFLGILFILLAVVLFVSNQIRGEN